MRRQYIVGCKKPHVNALELSANSAKHPTFEAAVAEAERLAASHIGSEFYVFAVMSVSKATTVSTEIFSS